MCTIGHPNIPREERAFESMTIRLPHFPNREAYQEDGAGSWLWMRNCPACKSTVYLPVAVRR